MMRCHRIAVTLVGVLLACSSGRSSSGSPEARLAVVAAMEHYTTLIRAVASDSIAAMYTEDGELRTPKRQWKLTRLLMQPAPSSAQ